MIGHIEVHQRIGAIGGQDHGQAVVQLVHLVGDGELALLLALFGDQVGAASTGRVKPSRIVKGMTLFTVTS